MEGKKRISINFGSNKIYTNDALFRTMVKHSPRKFTNKIISIRMNKRGNTVESNMIDISILITEEIQVIKKETLRNVLFRNLCEMSKKTSYPALQNKIKNLIKFR